MQKRGLEESGGPLTPPRMLQAPYGALSLSSSLLKSHAKEQRETAIVNTLYLYLASKNHHNLQNSVRFMLHIT